MEGILFLVFIFSPFAVDGGIWAVKIIGAILFLASAAGLLHLSKQTGIRKRRFRRRKR